MEDQKKLTIWLKEMRANFLILSVFLVAIGVALAFKYGLERLTGADIIHILLLVVGIVSAHISVNLFNEYSDYKTKIDFNTKKTPFSGGSGILISGQLKPSSVMRAAIISLLLAFVIGIYFSFSAHWLISLIMVIGALSIIGYTNFFAKYLLGELLSGLSLGTLVVIGAYIALTAEPSMALAGLIPPEVVYVSLPPGILTALLLLLNEFPDVEADKAGGRNHLVIQFGKRKAAIIYSVGLFLTFLTIILLPIIGVSTYWLYLALIPLPVAIKTSITAMNYYNDINKLIPALGGNVIVVLSTDLLLAVSIFIHY